MTQQYKLYIIIYKYIIAYLLILSQHEERHVLQIVLSTGQH